MLQSNKNFISSKRRPVRNIGFVLQVMMSFYSPGSWSSNNEHAVINIYNVHPDTEKINDPMFVPLYVHCKW